MDLRFTRGASSCSACSLHRNVVMNLGLAIALGAAVALSASADFWNGPTHYLHTRTGMPDLDQQRSSPPICALAPFPAIPTPGGPCAFLYPGGMHCGPASGVNLYLYMANHGYPTLLPAEQIGDIWEQPQWFCQATAHIATLGSWSGWSLGGTSTYGMMAGLQRAVNNHRQPIVVKHYLAAGTYGLNLNQLAETGRAGAIAMVAYGYYKVVGVAPGNVPIVQRQGGHFVVMTGAYRNGPVGKLRIRDPADDGCAPDLPTQNQFKHHVYNAQSFWVRATAPGLPFRWMTRIYPETDAPAFGIGSTIKLLDGMVYCFPRRAVGKKIPPGGGPPEFFRIEPDEPWAPGGGGAVCNPIVPLMDAELVEAVAHPDGRGILAIVATAMRPEPQKEVWGMNLDLGTQTVLAQINDAESLLVGRDRAIYVLGGSTLHRLGLPDDAEEPRPGGGGEDDAGAPPSSFVLPFTCKSFEYDDLNDRVVLLASDGAQIAFVDHGFQTEASVFDLPEGVRLGTDGIVTTNPLDGVVWVGSPASSTVLGLVPSAAGKDPGTMEVVDQIDLPLSKGSTIRDIDFLEENELVVSTSLDGAVHFSRGGGDEDAGWRQVLEDSFQLPCDIDGVVIERPRGNFDPAEHKDPGFDNLDPGDLIPGIPVPDPLCAGDLNEDGVVDGQDLGLVLGAWGPANVFIEPADFNSDGQVDGNDLGSLLGWWGPCP